MLCHLVEHKRFNHNSFEDTKYLHRLLEVNIGRVRNYLYYCLYKRHFLLCCIFGKNRVITGSDSASNLRECGDFRNIW